MVVVGTTVPKPVAPGLDVEIVEDSAGVNYAGHPYKMVALIGAVTTFILVLLLVVIITDLGVFQRVEHFITLCFIEAIPQRVAAMAA